LIRQSLFHRFAERILHGPADDLDGWRDDQSTVRSLIGGPEPTTQGFTTSDEQTRFVVSQIDRHLVVCHVRRTGVRWTDTIAEQEVMMEKKQPSSPSATW
jgi:hypothetical protein